jgi:hypothetical protein
MMFKKLLPILLLAGGSLLAADFSVGVHIGAPPPPRVVYYRPARPGPRYIWVNGYWYPDGRHYRWHNGYWTRPPRHRAVWVEPRYERERYYVGYWR